jgi:hypothetical protein
MGKYDTQDKTADTHTKVGGGVSRDSGQATTEFIIASRDGSGSHDHVVISDTGAVLHDTTGSAK